MVRLLYKDVYRLLYKAYLFYLFLLFNLLSLFVLVAVSEPLMKTMIMMGHVSKIAYYVSSGTLYPVHSFTHSPTPLRVDVPGGILGYRR